MSHVFQHKFPVMLALDISPYSIKLLELSSHKKAYTLERYAIQTLTENLMQNREINNSAALGKKLAQFVQRSGTPLKQVAVAISGQGVFTKTFSLPSCMREKELEKQLVQEAQGFLPFSISEAMIDFQELGPSQHNPQNSDVLFVATRAQRINTLIEALSIAQLSLKLIDVERYALTRALRLLPQATLFNQAKSTIGLLDIGATKIALHVVQDSVPIETLEIHFGIKQLTDQIAQCLGLSLSEVQLAIKKVQDKSIREMIDSFSHNLIQHLKILLQSVKHSITSCDIHALILTGGGAVLPNLAFYLEQQTALNVIVADPIEQISVAPSIDALQLKNDISALMVCFGLALRSFRHEH